MSQEKSISDRKEETGTISKLDKKEYEYTTFYAFRGTLAMMRWVEKQVYSLIEKIKAKGLKVDFEASIKTMKGEEALSKPAEEKKKTRRAHKQVIKMKKRKTK